MKRTLKNYLTVLFGTGLGRFLSFFTSVLIARSLGPEDFGKYSIFFIVMMTVWLIPQAFDATFVRYAKTASNEEEKRIFLRSTFFLKIIYSGIVTVFAYPLALVLSNFFFHKPELTYIISIAFISGVFLSFLMSIASIYQEKEQFGIYAFVYSFYTIFAFFSIILLRMFPKFFTVWNVVVIQLLIALSMGLSSLMALLKRMGQIFPLHLPTLKQSFSLGKWIFGVTFVSYIFQRLDTFFVTRYLQLNAVGIYSTAQQIIMAVSLMTGSLNNVFLPKASCALVSKEAFFAYRHESIIGILLINGVLLLLMLFAPLVIKIFYGEQYAAAGSLLRILLVGWFFSTIYLPFSSLFYTMEDSRSRFLLELLKLILMIVVLVWSVPRYGLVGSAIGMSSVLLIHTILSLCVLRKRLVQKYREWFYA